MSNDTYQDRGDLRRYFGMIPHIVDDMGLTPYAVRLYVHLKRITGERGGKCTAGVRSLARVCGVSIGAVTNAKRELETRRLIVVTERITEGGLTHHEIELVDLWRVNLYWFTEDRARVNLTDLTIKEAEGDGKSVHTANGQNESVRTVNATVHQVNGSVHLVIHKNNNNKEGGEIEITSDGTLKDASQVLIDAWLSLELTASQDDYIGDLWKRHPNEGAHLVAIEAVRGGRDGALTMLKTYTAALLGAINGQ